MPNDMGFTFNICTGDVGSPVGAGDEIELDSRVGELRTDLFPHPADAV